MLQKIVKIAKKRGKFTSFWAYQHDLPKVSTLKYLTQGMLTQFQVACQSDMSFGSYNIYRTVEKSKKSPKNDVK